MLCILHLFYEILLGSEQLQIEYRHEKCVACQRKSSL